MLPKDEVREDLREGEKWWYGLSSTTEIKDTNKKRGAQMELHLFVTDKDLEKYPQCLARATKVKNLPTYSFCLQ